MSPFLVPILSDVLSWRWSKEWHLLVYHYMLSSWPLASGTGKSFSSSRRRTSNPYQTHQRPGIAPLLSCGGPVEWKSSCPDSQPLEEALVEKNERNRYLPFSSPFVQKWIKVSLAFDGKEITNWENFERFFFQVIAWWGRTIELL